MKRMRTCKVLPLLLMMFLLFEPVSVRAGEIEEPAAWSLDDVEFEQVDSFFRREAETNLPSFKQIMEILINGQLKDVSELLLRGIKDALLGDVLHGSKMVGQILIIGVTGAVLAGFANVFQEKQMADTTFLIIYLLMASSLLAGFLDAISVAEHLAVQILEFMRALLPAYMLTIAWSGGTLTGIAWHGLLLFVITLAERILVRLVFPLMKIYLILTIAGHMTGEDFCSGFTSLIAKGVRFSLRSLMGIILGFHLIQGMVLPYADSVKNAGLRKTLAIIPGIGAGADAATQMVLGSGVLIKNTMGAAGMIALFMISLAPVLKLMALMLLYQLTAAALLPICDHNLVTCLNEAAAGHRLLLEIVITLLALFILSIALICSSTNATYLV